MPEVKSVPLGSAFAYEVGIRTLDEQERRIMALDSKAGVVLAASGVLAGFIFRTDSFVRRGPIGLGIAVVIALSTTMTTALAAFATRRYRAAPGLRSSIALMARDDQWLRWRFLCNLLAASDENEHKLRRKARLVGFSLSTLLVTILMLAGYLAYTLI